MLDYLVYANYGTFSGLTEAFRRIHVSYPSETIISLAAANVMSNSKLQKHIKDSMFRYFRSVLDRQDSGNRGELAVCLIILESVFQATAYRPDKSISLENFFRNFLGTSFQDSIKKLGNQNSL